MRPSAYLQALADGSDFVVGPLTREEVAALATSRRPRDDRCDSTSC
jgi:outer membrane PBP1 activator LpoA protein